MKKIKNLIIIFILVFPLYNSVAQKSKKKAQDYFEVESFSTKLVLFVKKLSKEVDGFFKKEEAENFERALGYFKTDLEEYLILRKNLMETLEKNNYKKIGNVKQDISNLKLKLKDLRVRIRKIKPFVSSNLTGQANKILNGMIRSQNKNHSLYLTKLEELIRGVPGVNKKQLKINGQRIYNELEKSAKLIGEVQEQLKTKFKIQEL